MYFLGKVRVVKPQASVWPAQLSVFINSQLAGTYKAVGPDVVLGGGFLRVKNEKGVTMTLWTFKQMQELQVPDSGMKVELKK